MAIPTDKNISVKVTEKLSKCKDLEIEIEQMWGMKATTIPMVIGALGRIKKGIYKYIQKIPGEIQELQKIALLRTSHILRKGTIHQIDFNLVLTLGGRMGRLLRPIIA